MKTVIRKGVAKKKREVKSGKEGRIGRDGGT